MSNAKELQDEEKEVLISIYEGDSAFKQVSETVYQYKVFIVGTGAFFCGNLQS